MGELVKSPLDTDSVSRGADLQDIIHAIRKVYIAMRSA